MALSINTAPTEMKMSAAANMTALAMTTHTDAVALETETAKPKQ